MGVCVAGCAGRMGRELITAIANSADLRLTAALEHAGNPALGHDPGQWSGTPTGIVTTDNVEAAIAQSQVLVDFTRPDASLRYLRACVAFNRPAVVGTTGFSDAQRREIAGAAAAIPLVFSPNMSIGVNLALSLLHQAARVLDADYDVEIVEAHHRHKVDAPSGTALRMGEVVASAQGRRLADAAVHDRHGVIGERKAGSIGFASVRGGDIVGDHTVLFAGIGERLEITHKASSRATFAQGALRAARFLIGRPPGQYEMVDVLGLPPLV